MKMPKLFLIASLLAASFAADAAVRMAPDGVMPDHARAALRRGAETLYPVRVDRHWVEESVELGGLWLPSTGTAPVLARFERSMRSLDGNWTWVGKVDTRLGQQAVILTFGDHAVFGMIPQQTGLPLRIETRHGQSWLVEGGLPTKILPHGQSDGLIAPARTPLAKTTMSAAGKMSGGTMHAASASPVIIDVLVAYNLSVVAYYGSDSAAQTRIDYLASVANQAYVDSQINQQIRIVAKKLLDYNANTDNDVLLNLITNASADPVKTQIDAWRTQYGADLVSVIRAFDNASQTNCGLAWIGEYAGNPPDPGYGFSVVGDGANGGFYCADQTFAHELGHNMGGQHDIVTSGGETGAFSYSHGFRQTIDSGTGFATVMAYSVDPQTLLSIFSNPRLNSCMGQPCGDATTADNARTFNETAAETAAFVPNVVPVLPTLSIGDVTITEGNSGTKTATFTVTLSATSASAVTYNIATADDSAIAGSDYVASSLVGQSIPAGQTSKTFSVTINGDATNEANEDFTVSLSSPSGATLADGFAIGTISNDDGPTLSIADVSTTEGNSGTKLLTFTVHLSTTSGSPVTYNILTADAGATAGSDYVASTLTGETIPAGQTSKTFSVTINGDATIEPNEALTVTATSVTGATVTDATAVGTIINDDGPTLSIADVSLSEGNSGTKLMNFTVQMSATSLSPVSLDIATANGTATAGSDYVAKTTNGAVIPAGQTSVPFSVTINGDATIEGNETFLVNLSGATGASIADSQAVGTISNDDTVQPSLSIGDVAVSEGNSGTKLLTFTVQLSAAASTAVTYNVSTPSSGTATAGVDYVSLPVTAQSIPAGTLSKTISVTINGDTAIEANENFFVNVSSVVGATVADATAVGTITNDDFPSLSIGDAAISEGNSGTKLLTFTVHLSAAAATAVTYNVSTPSSGTATAGVDYVSLPVTAQSIPAGTLSKTISVTLNGDTAIEANEAFYVNVSSVVGATVSDPTAVGTITNDDFPSLSIGDASISEGNSGTKLLTFTVQLSAAAATAVTYNVSTPSSGTATAGVDYVTLPVTAQSIPAGTLSKTISVTINGDTAVEANEAFYVNVSSVVGATVADPTAVGTITNDD